ncbi:MAG: peroxiredoxin [Vicingaceae bacterium]
MAIDVGSRIPTFELRNQKGEWVKVSANDGKIRVIYFYPKNNTKVCTDQACSFRDWYDDLLDYGCEVIGISSDSVDSHQSFSKQHKLNFTLLSDPDGKVREMFGATKLFGLIPSRKTFVIDKKGKVIYTFDALFESDKHVKNVLEQLELNR